MRDVVLSPEDMPESTINHQEWYWDVNGDQWSQPFLNTVATVHIPKSIASDLKFEPKCFTGSFGSTESNCEIVRTDGSEETRFVISATDTLGPSENMSFVLGFNLGTFTGYKTDPKTVILATLGFGSAFSLPSLVTGIFLYGKWKKTGKDPKGKGVIVPQYDVPQELNPVLADIILNERMQIKAISATLIDLCVQGYVKLYEVKKDKLIGSDTQYEVELIKATSSLSAESQKVVTMIFSGSTVGAKVNLSELKNKLYSQAQSLTTAANQQVATQGYFVTDPTKARRQYVLPGVILLGLGVMPAFFLPIALLATAGISLAGIILLFAGNFMPQRTLKGVAMKEYLLGLEDYMKMAESDRIKFLQSPSTAEKIDVHNKKQLVKLYEKLLPYAMLFGIEKQWAKQFADLYGQGQSPSWYSGHTAFNAVMFSNAVNGFSSAANSSFTAPSSSGSSGFSGGGFSGGGGGGGGGGGW